MDGLDAAILEAAWSLSGDGDVSCAEVLDAVGGDQAESYARMVRLMDSRWLWFPMLEGIGNIGDRDVEPMWPTHVRCRVGAVAHAVLGDPEHPALLADGDLYRGGTRAPYAPDAVTTALRHAAAQRDTATHPDGARQVALGSPAFPTGCHVDVEADGSEAGELTTLTLRPEILSTTTDGGHAMLLVRALPPGAGAWSMLQAITHRASIDDAPVFAQVDEVSAPGFDHASRLTLVDPTVEPAARALIGRAPRTVQTIPAEPAQRAVDRLLRWVAHHGREEALRVADQLDGPWRASGEQLARRTSTAITTHTWLGLS